VAGDAPRSDHRHHRLEHSSQLRVLDAVSLWLRGLSFPLVLLDHAVDRGQVGLLCRTVEPRVDLHPLEEKGFQDGIAFRLMSLRERPTVLFHSYPPKRNGRRGSSLAVPLASPKVRELDQHYPALWAR
jgi:hypothetical protein